MSTPSHSIGAASGRFTRGLAVMLVASSGTLMLAAGQALALEGWARSRPLAIGGGVAIQMAFLVERRRVRRSRQPREALGRAWPRQVMASGLAGMTGLGLVLVGHNAVAHGWWPIVIAVVPLVLVVVQATVLNGDAAAIRSTTKRSHTILTAPDAHDGAGDRHPRQVGPAGAAGSPRLFGFARRHAVGSFITGRRSTPPGPGVDAHTIQPMDRSRR